MGAPRGHDALSERFGELSKLGLEEARRLGFLARRPRPVRIALAVLAVLLAVGGPVLSVALRIATPVELWEQGAAIGLLLTLVFAWRGAARRDVPTERGIEALRLVEGIRALAESPAPARDAALAQAERLRREGAANAAERLIPFALAIEVDRRGPLVESLIDAAERLRFAMPGPRGVEPPAWIPAHDPSMPLRRRLQRVVVLTRVGLTGVVASGMGDGGGSGGAIGSADGPDDGRWWDLHDWVDVSDDSSAGGDGDGGDGGGDGGGGGD